MLWIRSGTEILRSRRSLAVVAGMKKPEWPRRTDKSRTLKTPKNTNKVIVFRITTRHCTLTQPLLIPCTTWQNVSIYFGTVFYMMYMRAERTYVLKDMNIPYEGYVMFDYSKSFASYLVIKYVKLSTHHLSSTTVFSWTCCFRERGSIVYSMYNEYDRRRLPCTFSLSKI